MLLHASIFTPQIKACLPEDGTKKRKGWLGRLPYILDLDQFISIENHLDHLYARGLVCGTSVVSGYVCQYANLA